MPGGSVKLLDVRKLAETRPALTFDIPVAELPGLPAELVSGTGSVQALVQFGREQGFTVAQVALTGQLQLICQRCMQPLAVALDANSSVLLLESEADAARAPLEWETYLASDGRLSVPALVAEELLLALPIVPLHDRPGECADTIQPVVAEPVAEPVAPVTAIAATGTTRPFADLRALLQSGAPPKS